MICRSGAQQASSAAVEGGIYRGLKMALDLAGALLLVVVLSPLMLAIWAAVRLDSAGPGIYRQQRVGRSGKPFTMLKFRTMRPGAPVLSTADMQRQREVPYTRLGPLLRKTSLDELPQLFNILRGQMSFIGPRPALPSQADVNALREQTGADRVRPGITGLAQVMGRDDLPVDVKVDCDARYCRELSLLQDLRILCLTVRAVVSCRGNK